MTLATGQWPAYAGPQDGARRRSGTLAVWRLELAKLRGQWRVRIVAAACLLGPFVVVAGLHVQNVTPNDTLFGQWLHTSGFAVPMVILGFGGQWLLPAGAAIVAGDIFSADDHFGTWKTILTRSRTRGELFTGKFLAALTFALAALLLLTATGLLAALVAGPRQVPGLGGQLVPAGQAAELVLVSWLSVIPPVLGFTALAIAASVASRNSVIGIGVPVVLTLVFQVVTLLALPEWGQQVLLSTPFLAWHGFWGQPAYTGPFLWGLLSSGAWFTVCTA
ncbi:MAG TPA: ABC transporter permease, partial [Streptosporangiaceae bacterium]